MTSPRSFQGQSVIPRLGLVTINLTPNLKSMFTHYEDMKGNAKCRNRSGFEVRGHPRSLAMYPHFMKHI